MIFPKLNNSKVKSYYPLLTLSIKSQTEDFYIRKYYKVKYWDYQHLVFLTTNELDYEFNSRVFEDEFCLIRNFEHLVSGFENSEFVDFIIDSRFNSPPKYIYYDIILINKLIKPAFLKHLRESILGYTDADFTEHEKSQLKKWFTCLKDDLTIY